MIPHVSFDFETCYTVILIHKDANTCIFKKTKTKDAYTWMDVVALDSSPNRDVCELWAKSLRPVEVGINMSVSCNVSLVRCNRHVI
jgi:hypothetical protein